MRFDEVSLERYGGFERCSLSLGGPGLTVVYGRNEAGKSTLLRAARDFLFRIPERSSQVARFGSDVARVSASLTTADGARLSLTRRCGRARTLMDASGAPCDEGVLSSLLGAVDRDRFATLFGLDHESLRSGGDALLRADGDVGRLIVEAGGGLRTLMGRLDALDVVIDGLFAPRRKEGRAFYKALSAFEVADKAYKAALLTREAYERDAKAHEAAGRDVVEARRIRREVGEALSQLRRVERVIPILRRLDDADGAVEAHADVSSLSPDVPHRCDALVAADEVEAARLAALRARHADVLLRFEALVIDDGLCAAEVEIRDVAEQIAVVRAARGERPARTRELHAAEAQLDLLRERLGMRRGQDLATSVPSHSALASVRELADRAASLDPRRASARQSVERAARAVAVAAERLNGLTARGFDEPFGIGAAAFGTLPSACAAATGKIEAAAAAKARARALAEDLGFHDVKAAKRLRCPTEGQVRDEVDARDALAAGRTRLLARMAEGRAALGAAVADVEALHKGGEVATDDVVAGARQRRDKAWEPMRLSYLGERPMPSQPERRAVVEAIELDVAEADRLADRRSSEAGRVAALAQAERRASEARAAISATAEAARGLSLELADRVEAFRAAFPAACAMRPELAALLPFSLTSAKIADLLAEAEVGRRDGEAALRRLEPLVDRFAWAERKAGIAVPAGDDISGRVHAVSESISAHERSHDAHGREAAGLVALRADLADAERVLADVARDHEAWSSAWAGATATLGLAPDEAVAVVGDLASGWASVRGDLDALAQIRRLLSRMDDVEAELGSAVAGLGHRLGLPLPADPVAAGTMLKERWAANDAARLRRAALLPEVRGAEVEVVACELSAKRAGERLASLSEEVGVPCDRARLRSVAARRRAYDKVTAERDALVEAVRAAGDGLPLETLREEIGGRDLDAVRGQLEDIAGRLDALDAGIEVAIGAEQRAGAALGAHRGPSSNPGLMAAREAAVADMHDAVERYVALRLAREMVGEAVQIVRAERQDPLVREAGALFARMTRGEYEGVAADVDDRGTPVVVGVRAGGRGTQPVATMSDGTRDQLFLAFRLASLAAYCASAEPLPFIADDILVHVDDERGDATLDLLADFGRTTQVLLFTHHRSVFDAALRLASDGRATAAEIGG